MNTEPSLDQIDDYNNNESKEKRTTVRLIVVSLLIIGAIYGVVKYNYNSVDDYVGTKEQPGINIPNK
ncbi:hypothetical protein ALC152_12110 [Arcobacter sp. 15-2]|uniref:hypothetical protein n=1 Tax=Arcobacter sp. 15-2 TaxID=3374109 RepID=UPI00399C5DB1